MQRICIIALAFIVSACASYAPSNPAQLLENGKLIAPANQGVAIVSMTVDVSNRDSAHAALDIVGDAANFYLTTWPLTDFIRTPGEQANPVGKVFTLALPAGQYTLQRVTGSWKTTLRDSWFDEREYVNVPLNKPFTVKAGEVIYLGEVHLNMNFQSDVQYLQNAARDFHHLNQRYGISDTSNVKMRYLSAQ